LIGTEGARNSLVRISFVVKHSKDKRPLKRRTSNREMEETDPPIGILTRMPNIIPAERQRRKPLFRIGH
jgi:hypothetical protein